MNRLYWPASFSPNDTTYCDRCGDHVPSVGTGKLYWDRRRKGKGATYRYLCEDCFFAWQQIRSASYRRYKSSYFQTWQVFAGGEGI